MRDRTTKMAALPPILTAAGMMLGRSRLVGPNPGTFFAPAVLATLSIGGVAYGFRDTRRIARLGTRIGDCSA